MSLHSVDFLQNVGYNIIKTKGDFKNEQNL